MQRFSTVSFHHLISSIRSLLYQLLHKLSKVLKLTTWILGNKEVLWKSQSYVGLSLLSSCPEQIRFWHYFSKNKPNQLSKFFSFVKLCLISVFSQNILHRIIEWLVCKLNFKKSKNALYKLLLVCCEFHMSTCNRQIVNKTV